MIIADSICFWRVYNAIACTCCATCMKRASYDNY